MHRLIIPNSYNIFATLSLKVKIELQYMSFYKKYFNSGSLLRFFIVGMEKYRRKTEKKLIGVKKWLNR